MKKIRLVLTVLLATAALPLWGADLYRWRGRNGVTYIGRNPPYGVDKDKVEVIPDGKQSAAQPASLEGNPGPLPFLAGNPALPLVELYTSARCGAYCLQARAFLIKRKIDFREYDVLTDVQAALRKKQLDPSTALPVAVINGQTVIGYSQEAYEIALGQ